jgi:hypothetical protein
MLYANKLELELELVYRMRTREMGLYIREQVIIMMITYKQIIYRNPNMITLI